jgi:branched-chain amino acid transport system substrate-binding protein
MVLVSAENSAGLKLIAFRDEFLKTYGKQPGTVAEYAFDGMNLLIQSIASAGTDRDEIRKALTKIKYDGVTGSFQFDEKGKRIGKINLAEIKNGVPVPVER